MAATAAAIAAASAALSSLQVSTSLITKPTLRYGNFRTFSSIRSSISTSTSNEEFNITFGTGTKQTLKPKPDSSNPSLETPSAPVFIPWIVRGEDGKLKLQSTPPVRLLHEMAVAKTSSTVTKKKKTTKKGEIAAKGVPTPEPKYSKAARRFYNENFRDPPQRLSKVLAAAGVASRRSSEELIFQGRVTVNGSVCNTPQTLVDPGKDSIYVNGSRISKKLPPKVYIALNKPKGYICSSGEKETKSALSLVDDYMKGWIKINPGLPKPRLFTVGRLDVATTGLIIITNDGDFAQRISHPSSGLSKEYIAAIDGAVTQRHLRVVSEGTVIEGVHCRPDSVELLPQQPDMSRPRLRIVVHEGRNHEVRELVKNAGLKLHSLKRIRIGGYRLPSDLGLGKHVQLNQGDIKSFGGKN